MGWGLSRTLEKVVPKRKSDVPSYDDGWMMDYPSTASGLTPSFVIVHLSDARKHVIVTLLSELSGGVSFLFNAAVIVGTVCDMM